MMMMMYKLLLLLLLLIFYFIAIITTAATTDTIIPYVLFKPYGNDYKCLNESNGGLGFIIQGNKTCIGNDGISLTVNVIGGSGGEFAEICKYNSNNCKNEIACEKFIANGQECYDPFDSSFFYNSPIPSSYTRMFIINSQFNNSYFNNSVNNFGYNFKQYRFINDYDISCQPESLYQFSLFITNNFYYLPNQKYQNLSQTFKCNQDLNIPQLLIGISNESPQPISIIDINQTNCINSNNLNNEYNYQITC